MRQSYKDFFGRNDYVLDLIILYSQWSIYNIHITNTKSEIKTFFDAIER